MKNSDDLIEEIREINSGYNYPFPYFGFRKLVRIFKGSLNSIVPDYDVFNSDVRGLSSGPERFLTMTDPDLTRFYKWIEKSFYETYPQYKDAEAFITMENTPDLFLDMQYTELVRGKLCLLIENRYKELK